jgi:hypothetical protein
LLMSTNPFIWLLQGMAQTIAIEAVATALILGVYVGVARARGANGGAVLARLPWRAVSVVLVAASPIATLALAPAGRLIVVGSLI